MPQDSQGRYVPSNETFTAAAIASAAKGSTANGTAFDTAGLDSINATLTVTAVSGTSPTLDLSLQTTADGTNYYTVGSFTQATGATSEAKIFGPLGATSRWRWVIGGSATPTVTFSVSATADRDA